MFKVKGQRSKVKVTA